MDQAALTALFRRIILAGAPILSAGCQNNTCDIPTRDETVPVNTMLADAATTDGGLGDLLARCQASASDCTALCQRVDTTAGYAVIKQCELVDLDGGGLAVHVVYKPLCVGGRCPEGLAIPARAGAANPLGAWLAACAHLEAASVDAFEILAGELAAHRGPQRLIAAARAAARDERRHAAVMGRLAERYGSTVPAARVARGPIRDLESMARDNAAEGCGRETYAALIAWRQSGAAADPDIRAAMAGIARDETRHAALSWTVDAWAAARLAPAARRRVRDARHEAMDRLLIEAFEAPLAAPLRAQAGLPDADEAARMTTALRAQLPA